VKAGIVARPQEYAWSTDRHYRRGKGLKWLDVDRLLAMFGRGRSAAIRGYRRLMRSSSFAIRAGEESDYERSQAQTHRLAT
jgi:hypothetical protein